MRVPRGSWRMWGAVIVLLAINTQAHAFYWYGWPGSLVPPRETLTPPTEPENPNPPVGPPVPVDKPPVGPPQHTPEPSTGIIGLLGFGALAAARKWRKRAVT